MSGWRVLTLSNQHDINAPQLLTKTCFKTKSYTIFLTDLTNIWNEELDLSGIVARASSEESPIEVSKQDFTQLAILLDNVQKSLEGGEETTCRISRTRSNGINIQTSISLPEPLGLLNWKFCLGKRTSTTLKHELILPLLISSHIQHERINNLILKVSEKDKAITRMVDQYESSNLDLAAAFPSIGGLRSGRKHVKREQAARYVPGLQAFQEDAWRRDTGQLDSSDITTLGLFQEALSQCAPEIPSRLKSEGDETWWMDIPDQLSATIPKAKPETKPPPKAAVHAEEPSEDETEDEFETHENFKQRSTPKKSLEAPKPASPLIYKQSAPSDSGTTEDDEDLDALPKTSSQSQNQNTRKLVPRIESSTPETSPPSKSKPAQKPKASGFRIGGKAKKALDELPSAQVTRGEPTEDKQPGEATIPTRAKGDVEDTVGQKKTKKGFKIGGKGNSTISGSDLPSATESSQSVDPVLHTNPLTDQTSAPIAKAEKEQTSSQEMREETAEEKAERKRGELKRKNEELVKKQAQTKKKKRF